MNRKEHFYRVNRLEFWNSKHLPGLLKLVAGSFELKTATVHHMVDRARALAAPRVSAGQTVVSSSSILRFQHLSLELRHP